MGSDAHKELLKSFGRANTAASNANLPLEEDHYVGAGAQALDLAHACSIPDYSAHALRQPHFSRATVITA